MPSVSQAKNTMRRALSEIVDAKLTTKSKDALWDHFNASCAYCGVSLDRASRTGHIDHLVSRGGNGPKNRVLACATCNGDEKREHDWRTFIRQKSPDAFERQSRIDRIESWVAEQPMQATKFEPAVEEALKEAERLIDAFQVACTHLRDAVNKSA